MKKKNVEYFDSLDFNLEKYRNKRYRKYVLKLYALKYIPIAFLLFSVSNIIIAGILSLVWWLIITMFKDHRQIKLFNPIIRIWFGVPGSGKTSMASWLCNESVNNHYNVLSNIELAGAYKLEEADLGKYDLSFEDDGAHVIIDEATINGLDNRGFKEFAKTKKPLYFSIHRHMNNMVDIFSQSYDIDLKIKDRAGEHGIFHLSKGPFKGWVKYRAITKIFFIKKEDKQFVDGFKYSGLPRFCYVKPLWSSFDTLDKSMCPKEQKEWVKWYED